MPKHDKFTEPIRLGSTIHVLFLDKNLRKELQVVAPSEAEPLLGRMSVLSPLGRAILGKRRGDLVDLTAPGGKFWVQILEVDNTTCPETLPQPSPR